MSKPILLKKLLPLAEQVAEHLLAGAAGNPPDLSRTQVWVPTGGASRRIRHALAMVAERGGSGVLSPGFRQPMAALLPKTATASRTDRELAWGLVLKEYAGTLGEDPCPLFPDPKVLSGDQALLGTAGLLCDLCDLLAEGCLNPLSGEIQRAYTEEPDRWEKLTLLYGHYLKILKSHDLSDSNVAREESISSNPDKLDRLVIACIPDLPLAACRRAEFLRGNGVRVEVLVWAPEGLTAGFDAWGHPDPEEWNDVEVPLVSLQIVLANDPSEEAVKAVDFLTKAADGSHALILVDESLTPVLRAAVLERGGKPYLPEGEALGQTEPAIVACEWITLHRERRLRTLRRLLECPGFAGWIASGTRIQQSLALEACDHLAMVPLVESLDQAAAFLAEERPFDPKEREHAREHRLRMEEAARDLLKMVLSELEVTPGDLLKLVWHDAPKDKGALGDVLETCDSVSGSKLIATWKEAKEPALLRAISRKKTYGISQKGETELSGLLEAPWTEASVMALCGCTEGKIPTSVDGHPFLPNSVRKDMGLSDNASRRARDSYLLSCLARVRGKESFCCSFSKFGADGSPLIPSGLLMQCARKELPDRVIELFRQPEAAVTRVRRSKQWKWDLKKATGAVTKISPTDFKEYLACPFRYYLKKQLWIGEFNSQVREINALDFGNLIHRVLERFARGHRDEALPERIFALTEGFLHEEIRARFGPEPSPVVRVQAEAALVRLRSFARVQSQQYAEGWRILDVERKIEAESLEALSVGGLKLSAQLDRIDKKEGENLIQIIDYKTQMGEVKAPSATHFGPNSGAWMEEASVVIDGNNRSWTDLQLPLYRRIAEKLYPENEVRTAYFILAADPEESRIEELVLDEAQLVSAELCAKTVAERVVAGVFWPPRPHTASWKDPFEALFLNGPPKDCFTKETIAFLKGEKEETLS